MEADAVFLGRHFPIVHGCERLHPCFRRPLGAGDEGKNARDTIFVSLNIEHRLQRFFEFFCLKRQRLVSVELEQEVLGILRTQILLGEGHEFFLFDTTECCDRYLTCKCWSSDSYHIALFLPSAMQDQQCIVKVYVKMDAWALTDRLTAK
jgi:hypothetical protein